MNKILKQTAETNLEEACKEEVRLAIEANQFVNVGGISMPWVEGIADGGWVKRSLGHSYDSNYGHAAIIGARTRKVLHYSWRQKVCQTCSRHEKKGETVPEHECYKNWDKASTAMEADIILAGFQESIIKHHFVYARFIGDGDSSVHSSVLNVYPGIQVKKVECINHVIRNVNSKLTQLSGPPSASGRKITQAERRLAIAKKEIPKVGKVLRNLCTFFNQRERTPENTERLRLSILNIAKHSFGNHADCTPELCEDAGTEDPQFSLCYQDLEIFNGVKDILKRPAALASSLIECSTSNIVESLMSVFAKYVEGKRKNLGGGNLYQIRVTAAVLAFNTSRFFAAELPTMRLSEEPNQRWAEAKTRAEKRRAQNAIYHKPKRVKLNFRFLGERAPRGDCDYGDNPTHPDIDDDDLVALIAEERKGLQVNEAQQRWIDNKTMDQADNALWFEYRKNRLTASNAGKVFKLGEHTSNHATLKTVLGHRKLTGKSLWNVTYGKLHEDEAAAAFTEKYPEAGELRKCGLIVSLDNGIFGASPDRRVGATGILEIKTAPSIRDHDPKDWPDLPKNSACPIKKNSDGSLSLKRDHDHFYQVVMQMALEKTCTHGYYYLWTPKGDFMERIEKTEALKVWNVMEPKLRRFWDEDMAPEIIDSRIDRGFKCRMPTYRLEAMKSKEERKKEREEAAQMKKLRTEERKKAREEKKASKITAKEEKQRKATEKVPRKRQIQVKIPLKSSRRLAISES